MLVVKYCKDGKPISDFYAKRFVDDYINNHKTEIISNMIYFLEISNEMVLNNFITIAMTDDPISKYIVFQFEEIPWEFDKTSGLNYCHPFIKQHFQLSNRLKTISMYNYFLKSI